MSIWLANYAMTTLLLELLLLDAIHSQQFPNLHNLCRKIDLSLLIFNVGGLKLSRAN